MNEYMTSMIRPRCVACGRKKSNPFGDYCYDCTAARNNERTRLRMAQRPLEAKAAAVLQRAIKKGIVLAAKGQICVDCGNPAKCLDHRDYRKPLAVEPVCVSCNKLRGHGSPYRRIGQIEHDLPYRFGVKQKPKRRNSKKPRGAK